MNKNGQRRARSRPLFVFKSASPRARAEKMIESIQSNLVARGACVCVCLTGPNTALSNGRRQVGLPTGEAFSVSFFFLGPVAFEALTKPKVQLPQGRWPLRESGLVAEKEMLMTMALEVVASSLSQRGSRQPWVEPLRSNREWAFRYAMETGTSCLVALHTPESVSASAVFQLSQSS
jgi:hypothetical protein